MLLYFGATTLSITTLGIMTVAIAKRIITKFVIKTLWKTLRNHCRYDVTFLLLCNNIMLSAGNTKGGIITVPLTSCLTGLDWSVLYIKTKVVSCHTADSKPVKQEVNGTVILPPFVFLAECLALCQSHGYRKAKNRLLKFCYVPATSAAQNRLLFYFFAAAVYSTNKQTRQALSSLYS